MKCGVNSVHEPRLEELLYSDGIFKASITITFGCSSRHKGIRLLSSTLLKLVDSR